MGSASPLSCSLPTLFPLRAAGARPSPPPDVEGAFPPPVYGPVSATRPPPPPYYGSGGPGNYPPYGGYWPLSPPPYYGGYYGGGGGYYGFYSPPASRAGPDADPPGELPHVLISAK